MALALSSLADLRTLAVDEIIDVRSPAEFAEDHIPGAVNLPVLSNEERAGVGTVYVQESRFKARKIGAALVAANAARHLQTYLADKPGGYRPLVYCWRGGQRSGSFASILEQIGWRVALLEGGYQTYRRLVVEALYHSKLANPVVLLDGNTGSAKTDLLQHLPSLGVQMIDLEGLANHRGSIFGAMAGGQPSQKAFESGLALAIAALDPARPLVLEAESSRIGDRTIPPVLWEAMKPAPRIEIATSLAERALYLTRAYGDVTSDPGRLDGLIRRLSPLHAKAVIDQWLDLAATAQFDALAAGLMAQHYDPRYGKQRASVDRAAATPLPLARLDKAGLADGAQLLADAVGQMFGNANS